WLYAAMFADRELSVGGVLVVPGPQLGPLLCGQCAAGRGDLGQLLEVFLPRFARGEQDDHGGVGAAVVVESVDATLGDVEEVAGLRVHPLGAVEQFDRALEDVERLGERLVEMRGRAAGTR